MANSRYQYVKHFEQDDSLLRDCWIVIRIDGRSFGRFTTEHQYEKPNDIRGIHVMNAAAKRVMEEWNDCILAYGHSDEFSFVLHKKTHTFRRRASKFMSGIVSLFSSSFVYYWNTYFGNDQPLQYPPTFDARAVLYPNDDVLRDYLSWRQVDCHINNMYNTVFWALVQKQGMTKMDAKLRLDGTSSSDKQEILFTQFNINYNNLPEISKKGSVLLRSEFDSSISLEHIDVIKKDFWTKYSYLFE